MTRRRITRKSRRSFRQPASEQPIPNSTVKRFYRECACGCGQKFVTSGRRIFISEEHKRHFYYERRKQHGT